MCTRALLTLIFALSITNAEANIITIPDDFELIQEGLDHSQNTDTVLVLPGLYEETLDLGELQITLASLVLTTGDASYTDSTILDGQQNGHSIIRIAGGQDARTKICGFTIQNGETDYGGGIYINNSSPTISHIVCRSNVATENGGGLHITQGSAPSIRYARFIGNSAGISGRSISVFLGSTLTLEHAELTSELPNSSQLRVVGSNANLFDVKVCGQIHANGNAENPIIFNFKGGEVYGGTESLELFDCEAKISRVLIRDNRSAIEIRGTLLLEHVTLVNNTDPITGRRYSRSILRNCILWNPDSPEIITDCHDLEAWLEISYCDIEGGREGQLIENSVHLQWDEGNIDEDPRFSLPATGDYSLLEGSPCIDAGDPDSPRDPDSTIADLGAFYFHQEAQTTPVVSLPVDHNLVLQAYPNPFNEVAKIAFTIPQNGCGSVQILSLTGRLMETLVEGNLTAGSHELSISGRPYANGLYIVQLNHDGQVENRKILLVK